MPTQMGSTVSESDSLRSTMGMLVTGSIMSPRILISTSIVVPPAYCPVIRFRDVRRKVFLVGRRLRSAGQTAQQAVRKCLGHKHRHIAADLWFLTVAQHEVKRLVLRGTADHLSPGRVLPFHHDFHHLSHMTPVGYALNLALMFLQNLQAARLLSVRNR